MNTQNIVLWLEGPLQSWGADSLFNRRDTIRFPTKSGVIGLILCAMGKSGSQKELLAQLAQFEHEVFSYKKNNNESPILTDFHMVGSGYDRKDSFEKLFIPKMQDGNPAVGGGTKLTYRYYLQNAVFAVIMPCDKVLAEEIEAAFICPAFDLYLGRKTCVPSQIIFQGKFDSHDLAQEKIQVIIEQRKLELDFSVIEGSHENKGDIIVLNDVPVQFGNFKKYRDRQVTFIKDT